MTSYTETIGIKGSLEQRRSERGEAPASCLVGMDRASNPAEHSPGFLDEFLSQDAGQSFGLGDNGIKPAPPFSHVRPDSIPAKLFG